MLLGTALAAADYRTVRLSAEDVGVVRLRGDGIQGVDWAAPGRGSVVVPVMVYRQDEPVTLDGKPWQPAFVEASAPAGESDENEEADQQARLWQPGRSEATRQWLLGAIVVGVIGLGLARHADPRRATRWMLVTAVVLSGSAVAFFPKDRPQVARPAAGRPGWEWLFVAGRPGDRVETAFGDDVHFLPASAARLEQADPVLHCDATGRPTTLSCTVPAGGRVIFLRRVKP